MCKPTLVFRLLLLVELNNFRARQFGGLGLINPIIKSKALLVRNMYKDFLEHDCRIEDAWIVNSLYGYPEEFLNVFKNDLATAPVKQIYDFLLQDLIYKNENFIPSRNEKKSVNVKWSVAWRNFSLMEGLTATEKCFAWKVQQDMLPVGVRIHRRNAERRCLTLLSNNQPCYEIQTLLHCFSTCRSIVDIFALLKTSLTAFLGRCVDFNDIVHFSFNHRNKKKLTCALWLAVKIMFSIFHDKSINKGQLLSSILKEINWNLDLNSKLGSFVHLSDLKNILGNM